MGINLFDHAQFYRKKFFSHFYICRKEFLSMQLLNVLENPDVYCKKFILKQDKTFTTTVAKIIIDNNPLIIKRYNIKNVTHAIKRSVRPSRAIRCFQYAHLLKQLHINTPMPIAMIEKRLGPLRRQAYFISEYVSGPDGFSVFRDNPADEETTKERAEHTLFLLAQLKKQQIYHGDLKASNFIYHDNIPYLIDLDAMRYYHSFRKAKIQLAKDEKRFLQNWEGLEVMKFFKRAT